MLFLVMKETNGFIQGPRINSPPINNPSVRPTPKVIDRTERNNPTSRSKQSVFQAEEGSGQNTNDRSEYCYNRPSQESIITEHLERPAIITDSDIKRIMIPEYQIIPKDRADQTQKMNEQFKRIEVGTRISRPQEIYEKLYQGKECKFFVTRDEDGRIRSNILNTKSGRLLIDTKLNDKE